MSNNSLIPKEIAIITFENNEAAVDYLKGIGFRQIKSNWFPDWEQEHFKLFRALPHTTAAPLPAFMAALINENGFDLNNYRQYFNGEWQRVIEVYVTTNRTTKYGWLKRKIGYVVPPSNIVLKDNVVYMWLHRPLGFNERLVLQDTSEYISLCGKPEFNRPHTTVVISNKLTDVHCNYRCDEHDGVFELSEREWKEAIQQCVGDGLTLNKRFLGAIGLEPPTSAKPPKVTRDYSLASDDMLRVLGHADMVDNVPMQEKGYGKGEPMVDLN